VVKLLLQAYPEALSLKGWSQCTPLETVLMRVEEKFDDTTQLSVTDPLITLLIASEP
jgi:hypothetical protein